MLEEIVRKINQLLSLTRPRGWRRAQAQFGGS